MAMTLMDFVSNQAGTWSKASDALANNRIELKEWDDAVTFQGPLHLNIAVVAQNILMPLNGGAARNSVNELYTYDLEIPAGYSWRYQMAEAPAATRLLPAYRVIIRSSPCARTIPVQTPDLPCDFAVGNRPGIGEFFPVGCEPCGSGPVRMPPTCGPSLSVVPASGGCVRPRFFNGMFITREDLETELRYLRIKNKLQRRADGQGVVWGLGIRREGGAVCVQPGYALDCCGNDLTVTSTYKVDVAILLSDPAICNQITGRQQCMSLLLEYVECPEEPRPVHGDPCNGTASACEMSRVRETVRLRLVPTRDYKPAQPIQTFLSTISQGNGQVATKTDSASSAPATASPTPAIPPFQMHFDARVDVPPGQPSVASLVLAPVQEGGSKSGTITFPTDYVGTRDGKRVYTVSISMPVPNASFAFSSGGVVSDSGNPAQGVITNQVTTPEASHTGPISWQITVPDPTLVLRQARHAEYTVNWTAPAGNNAPSGTYSGTLLVRFDLTVDAQAKAYLLTVTVTTRRLSVPVATIPFPCLNDACCPGKPLFPVTPPWADANPFALGQAADPKVLSLALVYALVAGTFAQENSAGGALSPKALLAAKLYRTAASSFDPAVGKDPAELSKVTQAVQQLLNDWCCAFLYPGPECDGEPHGVVIGCATIAGGDIVGISPWGGRRWVMHYPLLTYWGAQFGVVPADVLASRIFSLVCCLGNLPNPDGGHFRATEAATPNAEFAVGAGFIRTTAATPARSAAAPSPVRSIGLADFAARTLTALAQASAPAGTPMATFTLDGSPTIQLVVPDTSAGTGTTTTPVPSAVPITSTLNILAAGALEQPALRAAVPPLMRDFAQSLTAHLVNSLPLAALDPAQAILEPLTQAAITSVGAVLARSPQSLYVEVLGKTQAAALSELIQKAESKVTEVAKAVGESIEADTTARKLVSPDDLSTNVIRAAWAQRIAQTLRISRAPVLAGIVAALA